MSAQEIAAAMERVQAVFRRRPEAGLHDDSAATVRWMGGLRTVASHAEGHQVATEMPAELGGVGDQVTPGWLVRAGLASCAATRIAMEAAARGIELKELEVQASSRSDARGLLGMAEANGAAIDPGPRDLQLKIRISAPGVAPEVLRALVDESQRCSPVGAAIESAVPIAVQVDIVPG